MKIAVIGLGKTGSKVKELIPKKEFFGAFDREILENPNLLKGADVAIVFVPGNSAEELIPVLLQNKIKVIWAPTGFEFPKDFNQKLIEENLTWVYGSNFSLGMNIVIKMIKLLGKNLQILNKPEIHLNEIHHIHKKDAPSGTALLWEKTLGKEIENITSERYGDVVGTHQLTVKTETEIIYLEHQALDRTIFADGTIWAAKNLMKQKDLKGLISFEKLIELTLKESL